jgi:hypothetical protein
MYRQDCVRAVAWARNVISQAKVNIKLLLWGSSMCAWVTFIVTFLQALSACKDPHKATETVIDLRSSIGKHYWTEGTRWFITPSLSIYIGNILLNWNRTPLLPEEGTTAHLHYTTSYFLRSLPCWRFSILHFNWPNEKHFWRLFGNIVINLTSSSEWHRHMSVYTVEVMNVEITFLITVCCS